jgi:hypothetical protein
VNRVDIDDQITSRNLRFYRKSKQGLEAIAEGPAPLRLEDEVETVDPLQL